MTLWNGVLWIHLLTQRCAAEQIGEENRHQPALLREMGGHGSHMRWRRRGGLRGYFLGDYEGLDSIGTTFTSFFSKTTATDKDNAYLATISQSP